MYTPTTITTENKQCQIACPRLIKLPVQVDDVTFYKPERSIMTETDIGLTVTVQPLNKSVMELPCYILSAWLENIV